MTGQRGTGQLGPLQSEPVSVHAPFTSYPGGRYRHEPVDERRAALVAALVGVQLGAYDRRIVDWLARDEVSTVATVVSLILRVREAATSHSGGGEQR
jgi:hypothetical protein